MSHEMRTPLNAMLGFAQLLRTPGVGELTQRQDKYVQNIARAGRHLLALTNDVLDLSKIEAGRMDLEIADVDLAEVVGEAEEILRPLSGAKSLRVAVDGFELWVKADRLRLTQVLVNLLSNAIKFTADGGSVGVSAQESGGWVQLEVADSGRGIPVEDQTAVFESYTQGGNSLNEGTGLGLPLSRRLIELMAGELDLVTSSPLGSTFRIRIPAGAGPSAVPSEDAARPRASLRVVPS
jgi:signal transduction histidine kinase